jgi:hypothetical protein
MPIELNEIDSAINDLSLSKSPGPDGVSNAFYKIYKDYLLVPLQGLYNSMFIGHNIPKEDFFNADIVLIPKGDLIRIEKFEDSRPISLLNSDYKIFTKILANRIQSIIKDIIHEDQVGYIKKRNILDNVAILKFLESIDVLSDTWQLYIDFTKAFDTLLFLKR